MLASLRCHEVSCYLKSICGTNYRLMIDIYNYHFISTQVLFCAILEDSASNNFDKKTYKEVVSSSI